MSTPMATVPQTQLPSEGLVKRGRIFCRSETGRSLRTFTRKRESPDRRAHLTGRKRADAGESGVVALQEFRLAQHFDHARFVRLEDPPSWFPRRRAAVRTGIITLSPSRYSTHIGAKLHLQREARAQRCHPHGNHAAHPIKTPESCLHQSDVTTDPGRMLSKNFMRNRAKNGKPGKGMEVRLPLLVSFAMTPRLRPMKAILWIPILLATGAGTGLSEPLFTQKGTDLPFAELISGKKLPKGHNSTDGVTGSKINVNNKLVELTPEAGRRIPKDIRIHTLGNSGIPRGDFDKWSRWYQEDGSTQVFRLFKGETNVRNSRANAARIEAFSNLNWKRGDWHEWSGTYTIVKPHGAAIFQAKNNENDWSVQLNMNSAGDVILNHRRAEDKVIAKNMTGKPFHIRVRDNGHDYEVYLNGKKEGEGSYARPEGTSNFRWGMYLGSNEVKHEAMIFVSGVKFD